MCVCSHFIVYFRTTYILLLSQLILLPLVTVIGCALIRTPAMEQDLPAARRMEAFKRKREQVFAATKNTKRVERTSAVVSRERSAAATRQVPVELLAREWLCERGLEERRYLVESVLPSLVVALERLLTDVTSRGLEGSVERHNDFNPINTLAQHLMRSNPSHNAEGDGGHAYCQALEEVADELRKFGRAGDEAKLVALRKGVKERREMREREEAARSMEVQRRRAALEDELARWRLPTEEELATVEVGQCRVCMCMCMGCQCRCLVCVCRCSKL